MEFRFRPAALLVALLVVTPVYSQSPSADDVPAATKLSLTSLVEIRPSETAVENVVIVGMSPHVPGPLVDSRGNTIRTRTETRTRVVMVNGKAVTQTYTVSIPYSVNTGPDNTGNGDTSPPPEIQREIKIEDLQVWTIGGVKVGHEDLGELLTRPLAAFTLRGPWSKKSSIDSLQKRVLRDDVLLIYVPRNL